MKKLILPLLLLLTTAFYAQLTTIANYNFNTSTAYPVLPSATASNVISSGSSSDTFTVLPGTASGSGAFSTNSTAGNALAIANSSGVNTRYFLFQLSGADLSLYQAYKLYFQPQRSSAGANLITVAYSTNGSTYTNFASTYPVTTAFTDVVVDLSAVTALNNVGTVYIKLLLSGATATTGTLRIDNVEVQANKTGSGGGSGGGASGPWTVSGNNLNFTGNVGIGNATPLVPLDVTGDSKISGNLTVVGTSYFNGDVITTAANKTLTVGGRANFNGDVATAAGKTVTVGGSLIDNGSLTVVGTTSLNGDVVTAANKTLTVGGRSNFNGDVATAAGKTVTVGGSLIDNGSLTVVGTTSLNGDVVTAANKTLTVAGRANFNGDVATAAGKTVTVGGSLIDNGSLTVVGTTSLNGDVFTASNKTLTVAGRANFNGDVATAAGKTVTVGGSLIDNGSLTVVGTTSLNGDIVTAANKTLTVGGRANFNGDVATAAGKTVTVGGSLIDNGSLTVVGTTSLNGNIFTAANKTLTVGGDIITNKLTVSGNTNFNGALKSSALAGNGTSVLFVDALGNLQRAAPGGGIGGDPTMAVPSTPCLPSTIPWFEGGNSIGTVSGNGNNTIGTCNNYDFILKSNNVNSIWIKPTASIGFGIAAPTEKFHFSGGNVLIDGTNSSGNNYRVKIDGGVQPGLQITTTHVDAFSISDAATSQVNFKVKTNGETYSRHIKVMVTNFPDYVFEKDYKLLSLYDIEKYYLANKHLPEIPTAAEVEANNLDLGDMNKLLLKKIEEMTILMVEMKKEIDELKKSK